MTSQQYCKSQTSSQKKPRSVLIGNVPPYIVKIRENSKNILIKTWICLTLFLVFLKDLNKHLWKLLDRHNYLYLPNAFSKTIIIPAVQEGIYLETCSFSSGIRAWICWEMLSSMQTNIEPYSFLWQIKT